MTAGEEEPPSVITLMIAALGAFADDVRARRFPAPEHCYEMPADELVRLQEEFPGDGGC